jgi:hypothetical protein
MASASNSASANSTYTFDICTQDGKVIDDKEIKKITDSLWGFRLERGYTRDDPFKHIVQSSTYISSSQAKNVNGNDLFNLSFRIVNSVGKYQPIIHGKMNEDNKGFRITFSGFRDTITKESFRKFVAEYISWLNGQKTSPHRNLNSTARTLLGTYKLCNPAGGSRKNLRKTKRNKKCKRRTRRS